MDEEEFVGCISCTGKINLCELFTANENVDTYAKLLDTCFNIKVINYVILALLNIYIVFT